MKFVTLRLGSYSPALRANTVGFSLLQTVFFTTANGNISECSVILLVVVVVVVVVVCGYQMTDT